MDEFLKMDIFFFVTTIAVVVLAAFASLALWRLQKVLKNVEHISGQVAAESDNVRKDLAEMRSDIHNGAGKVKALLGFVDRTAKRAKKHS